MGKRAKMMSYMHALVFVVENMTIHCCDLQNYIRIIVDKNVKLIFLYFLIFRAAPWSLFIPL